MISLENTLISLLRLLFLQSVGSFYYSLDNWRQGFSTLYVCYICLALQNEKYKYWVDGLPCFKMNMYERVSRHDIAKNKTLLI